MLKNVDGSRANRECVVSTPFAAKLLSPIGYGEGSTTRAEMLVPPSGPRMWDIQLSIGKWEPPYLETEGEMR